MNDTTHNATDSALEVQGRVLADPGVSDEAKLMFCHLMRQEGFRTRWILSDQRWLPDDRRNLHELERAGYIALSDDDGLGARLVQFQGEDE